MPRGLHQTIGCVKAYKKYKFEVCICGLTWCLVLVPAQEEKHDLNNLLDPKERGMRRANWIQVIIGTETSLAPLTLCADRLCEVTEFGRALLVSTRVVVTLLTQTVKIKETNQMLQKDHKTTILYKPEAPVTMMPCLHVGSHFDMLSSYLKLMGDYKSKS